MKWEIAFGMHREREDIPIIFKNPSGAVALVHVQIDNGGALDAALGAQPLDGDGDIVEHAEARALCSERMMGSPRQVPSPSPVESVAGGRERSPDRGERPPH